MNDLLIPKRKNLGQSVHGFKLNGKGVASDIVCPLLDSLILNGHRSMTGYLNKVEKGTGHPSSVCRWVV